MNKLLIPPSVNWYESDILACSPDNTLIYGSCQYLVVIRPTTKDTPDALQLIAAHTQRIITVGINRNWGNPYKYAVTTGEDNSVKLWNIEKFSKIKSHSKHNEFTKSKIISAAFSGDDKIVSVSEKGELVIWKFNQNDLETLNLLCDSKISVTCLSICPHASWLAAFGVKSGLVIVADLRKNGKVLFKLRGHESNVVSLSWCPASVNIFPKKPCNKVIEKSIDNENTNESPTEKVDRRKQNNPIKRNEEVNIDGLILQSKYSGNKENTLPQPCMAGRKKGKKTLSDILLEKEKFSAALQTGADSPVDSTSVPMKSSNSTESNLESVDQSNASSSSTSRQSDASCEFSSADSCKLSSPLLKDESNNSVASDGDEVFHDANSDLKCFDEEPRREFLLASSSTDSNIYIWRAGTDGRLQTFINVPKKQYKNKNKNKKVQQECKWVAVCWVTPNVLLSSSRNAELIQWILPKPTSLDVKFMSVIHTDHWNTLFSIKAPIIYSNEFDFLQDRDVNVWTAGMERLIVNTDLKTKEKLNCYQTFGGSVNTIMSSPLDPTRLAIGTSEGLIHLWNLVSGDVKKVTFTNFYQKIGSSVTSLAWNPSNEMCLGFGTVEGKVGFYRNISKTKAPSATVNFFDTPILKVEWGPYGDLDALNLYVVAKGVITVFNIDKVHEEPKRLNLQNDTVPYTMSWKLDFSMLVVSTTTGGLFTYDKYLKVTYGTYLQHRLQSILWHPDSTTSDTSVSKYCNMFLSIVQSKNLVVYDMNGQNESNRETKIVEYKHPSVINACSWSPHCGSLLVFADDLGYAGVFNIDTQTIISSYIIGPLDPLLTVCWSPVDPDYIITGTRRQRITVWKVSENPPLSEEDIVIRKKKPPKELEQPNKSSQKTNDSLTYKKNDILPLFYKEKNSLEDITKLLHSQSSNYNPESLISRANVDVTHVYGQTSDCVNILNLNKQAFTDQGKLQNSYILSMFQGDMNNTISQAIAEKRVTPWLISMAPMVSQSLWYNACMTYIIQMEEDKSTNPIELVTYLLACHLVQRAVDVLCENDMYKEALVLAKVRCGPDSPIVANVFEQWAKYLASHGRFEMAAQSYIAIGKYQQAATVLFRRSNIETLELALELASLSGNMELCKAVEFRYNAFKKELDDAKNNALEMLPMHEQSKEVLMIEAPPHIETSQESSQGIGVSELADLEMLALNVWETSKDNIIESLKSLTLESSAPMDTTGENGSPNTHAVNGNETTQIIDTEFKLVGNSGDAEMDTIKIEQMKVAAPYILESSVAVEISTVTLVSSSEKPGPDETGSKNILESPVDVETSHESKHKSDMDMSQENILVSGKEKSQTDEIKKVLKVDMDITNTEQTVEDVCSEDVEAVTGTKSLEARKILESSVVVETSQELEQRFDMSQKDVSSSGKEKSQPDEIKQDLLVQEPLTVNMQIKSTGDTVCSNDVLAVESTEATASRKKLESSVESQKSVERTDMIQENIPFSDKEKSQSDETKNDLVVQEPLQLTAMVVMETTESPTYVESLECMQESVFSRRNPDDMDLVARQETEVRKFFRNKINSVDEMEVCFAETGALEESVQEIDYASKELPPGDTKNNVVPKNEDHNNRVVEIETNIESIALVSSKDQEMAAAAALDEPVKMKESGPNL